MISPPWPSLFATIESWGNLFWLADIAPTLPASLFMLLPGGQLACRPVETLCRKRLASVAAGPTSALHLPSTRSQPQYGSCRATHSPAEVTIGLEFNWRFVYEEWVWKILEYWIVSIRYFNADVGSILIVIIALLIIYVVFYLVFLILKDKLCFIFHGRWYKIFQSGAFSVNFYCTI